MSKHMTALGIDSNDLLPDHYSVYRTDNNVDNAIEGIYMNVSTGDRLQTITRIARQTTYRTVYYPTATTKLIIDDRRKFITYNHCIKGKWHKVNPTINEYGYLVYQVRKGNKIYNQYLHVLVYKTVNKDHKAKEGYHYVFKDGNKCNVHPSNLSYEPVEVKTNE